MRHFIIAFLFFSANIVFSQQTNGIYVISELLPNSEIETLKKNIVGFDIVLKNAINKESYSLQGEYQNSHIGFIDEDVPFETWVIDNFQTFTLGLQYNRILNNGWGFTLNISPQLSSNYDENKFDSNDVFVNGALVFEKLNEEKNTLWSFGIEYDTQNGLNYPIPLIAYSKRIDDRWAYKIGFPDSRFGWSFHKNHRVEAFTVLDGLLANINDSVEIYQDDYDGNLRNTYLLCGIGYDFTFLKNFVLEANAGHTVYNNMKVQDLDNEEIYDFEVENGFYFSFGLKYKLKPAIKIKDPYFVQ